MRHAHVTEQKSCFTLINASLGWTWWSDARSVSALNEAYGNEIVQLAQLERSTD